MAANEQNENQRGPAAGGISSQGGLAAYHGGKVRNLPKVPSPGRPGSPFHPRVISREDQAVRREAAAQQLNIQGPAKKSLDIGMPPGNIMIQGTADAGAESEEQGVAAAAATGFTGGFVAGASQNPQRASAPVTNDAKAQDAEPMPGLEQPLAVSMAQAVRGKPGAAAAPGNKVVMNPAHRAALQAIEDQQNNERETERDFYDNR